MEIPGLGDLSSLDLTDRETCYRILSYDKHQLLEGMIIEDLIDQVFAQLEATGIKPVHHSTLIAQRKEKEKWRSKVSAVWIQSLKDRQIWNYLDILSRVWPLIPVRYDEERREFLTSSRYITDLPIPDLVYPLQAQLSKCTGRMPSYSRISDTVKNADRQKGSFGGYLATVSEEKLEKLVLSRIFKNFGIQPFFDCAWDVDRILSCSGKLFSFEIKHKFPAPDKTLGLYFGLNFGERDIIRSLQAGGITCLHIIVVKPVWNKNVPPDYMRNDSVARTRAAVIAARLDAPLLDECSMHTGTSGGHTTLTGRGSLNYIKLPVNVFYKVGVLSDHPKTLADNIYKLIRGEKLKSVSKEYLEGLRITIQHPSRDSISLMPDYLAE